MADCAEKVIAIRAHAIVARLRAGQGGGQCRPVKAIRLARACGLKQGHESCRRRVREAVECARSHGVMICGNSEGYWEARDSAEWREYQAKKASGARFAFVRIRRQREAVTDRMSGQGKLFETAKAAF